MVGGIDEVPFISSVLGIGIAFIYVEVSIAST